MSPKSTKPRLLLFQPPVYEFALFDLFLKPFGLLRLGQWFKDSGYDVFYLNGLDYRDKKTNILLGNPRRNANGTGKFPRMRAPLPSGVESERYFGRYGVLENVLRIKVKEIKPDIIFITSGMTYWYQGVVEAVKISKSTFPDVPVVTGGIYANLMPDHCKVVTGADYVVSSNPEESIRSIVGKYSLPLPCGTIPSGPLMLEEVWKDAGVVRLNEGCPFHCDYCASDILCNTFISGNVENTFASLLEMYERFGTRNFAFYDDALLVNRNYSIKPFLELVLKKELPVKFYLPNAVHLQFLDKETAVLMKKSGFQEIRLGYESSSTDFHAEHDDKFSKDDIYRVVESLGKAGFLKNNITAYVLGGLPEQHWQDVERSIKTASDTGIRVSLAEYSPVPGTVLWQKSTELCPFPLEKEPLFHNNSFFPMKWKGYTVENMKYLKSMVQKLNKDNC
ncbi:MAG: cobalamin-dependent protein [Spirochaetaceae bacterium]|nr:cobalamin-dependent protein [Spirochaetaceae bacterium]